MFAGVAGRTGDVGLAYASSEGIEDGCEFGSLGLLALGDGVADLLEWVGGHTSMMPHLLATPYCAMPPTLAIIGGMTTKCSRCHRPLTSAKSIAAGMGRTCAKRTRQDNVVKGIKPATIAKAIELIEQGGIVPLRGRRIFQVISSDGTATYKTAPQACTCAAGIKGRYTCYHRAAALMLAA